MPKSRPVRKAVLPVAGLGTRFLPATKAVPKEMQTVLDRPVIQHVVDEAKAAGIEHFVFITGRGKGAIEDYFDIAYELQDTLTRRKKQEALDILAASQPAAGATSFTRQQAPLGLGHAVWCARDIIGDEPFALLLPDMLMPEHSGSLPGMMQLYNRTGGNIIATEEVPWEETHKYGVVVKGNPVEGGFEIKGMVEKPAPGTAPSNLYINGRYILQPEIFDILASQEPGAGGEIQLTDGMLKLAQNQPFYGYTYPGRTYDTGSKDGFILANVAYAMRDKALAGMIGEELRSMVNGS
jgi:UTP--glucose-1-phosphate uridylyltransferase